MNRKEKMERITKTANLQEVGNLLLSITIPITVNCYVDTCIKCLTNTVFMEKGGELSIVKNICGGTYTKLLCIKKKQDEEFSVYEYKDIIHLKREFHKHKYGTVSSNYIVNLDDIVSTINDMLSSGELLSEP